MNYEELVKALRYCKVDYCSSCLGCPMYADYEGSGCINEMHDSAAAAIEGLQADVQKRGEIVRCKDCRWGHLCIIGQHLGLDGFCSKGEREVQG